MPGVPSDQECQIGYGTPHEKIKNASNHHYRRLTESEPTPSFSGPVRSGAHVQKKQENDSHKSGKAWYDSPVSTTTKMRIP